MTVAQNIAFPLKMAGKAPERDRRPRSGRRSPWCTSRTRAGTCRTSCPAARSSASRSPAALVNRPAAAAARRAAGRARRQAARGDAGRADRACSANVGVTFVFVTHAQSEALALSHRIAVMNRGRVEQLDEPSTTLRLSEEPLRRRLHRQVQHARRRGDRGAAARGPSSLLKGLGEVDGERRATALKPGDARRAGAAPRAGPHRRRGRRAATCRTASRQGARLSLHRRCHDLPRRPAERAAHRGAAAQLRARPGQVLRDRRRGDGRLAADAGRGAGATRCARTARSRWLVGGPPFLFLLVFFAAAGAHHGGRLVPLSRASSAASRRSSARGRARNAGLTARKLRRLLQRLDLRRRSSPSPSASRR